MSDEFSSSEDLTPWLKTFVRTNFAEHNSRLFDRTPDAAIEIIVNWTLKGLVNNAVGEDVQFDPPEDDSAQETGT